MDLAGRNTPATSFSVWMCPTCACKLLTNEAWGMCFISVFLGWNSTILHASFPKRYDTVCAWISPVQVFNKLCHNQYHYFLLPVVSLFHVRNLSSTKLTYFVMPHIILRITTPACSLTFTIVTKTFSKNKIIPPKHVNSREL